MSVTIGRRAASQQRRESVGQRMSVVSSVLDAVDAQVAALAPGTVESVDADGLRRVVRALLPLALDDPTFDVTVTRGSTDVAVRVHHREGHGVVAEVVAGSAARRPDPGPEPPEAVRPVSPGVAAELATLLRNGAVRPR